ncbi:hypothetical protein N7505_001475 [Penicillium chrysogenum]|uniref:Zn(2)-C6 fungal-type domain-containing protein n=1 Tax=Penicillium chrysogenum TaxID=5076 RepID=A0ABQ8WX06_PENCH|nr:hypothetical protein N7505_001475 [Penicillium chrysogenum]
MVNVRKINAIADHPFSIYSPFPRLDFIIPGISHTMDSDATRHIRGPSGIKKSNKQGRRPGKIACTACHARKKRCDIAPHISSARTVAKKINAASREIQVAGVPTRPTRQQKPNRHHNSQKATITHEPQFHVNGFLPKGIDHDIPRWSAVYSSYSEMRRLLPSLTSISTSPSPSPEIEREIAHTQTAPSERRQDVSSSGLEASRRLQSGVLQRDCAEPSSIKGISIPVSRSRSRSLSPAPVGERVDLENAVAREAEIRHGGPASVTEGRVPRVPRVSRVPRVPRVLRVPGGGYDVFMNDLDALLRF